MTLQAYGQLVSSARREEEMMAENSSKGKIKNWKNKNECKKK